MRRLYYMHVLQYNMDAIWNRHVKKYRVNEQPTGEDRSTPVTVRVVESPDQVQKLLADVPGCSLLERNTGSSPSEQGFPVVIVALDGQTTVGFAAFKATSGAIRVAHELWVDPRVSFGVAPVAEAILRALESTARTACCSRLFVLMDHSTPLRKVLERCGYVASLTSAELSWYEKSLVVGPGPLESV